MSRKALMNGKSELINSNRQDEIVSKSYFCKGGGFILHTEALIFAACGGLISLASAHISLCQEVEPHISLCQEVEPDPLPP